MEKMSKILELLRQKYPRFGARSEEATAVGRWREVVGTHISRHARALRVKDGILWIEVDHPIWRSELHHRKAQILSRLNGGASPGEAPIRDLFLVESSSSR